MTPPALAYFRYGLKLRGPEGGNARSARRVLEGFLIRVAGGYGSVMPWPELGDAPLQDQWQAFRSGGSTPLLERARACAAADAAARRDGRSLLHQAPVPLSHATATGTADFGALRAEGFTAAKLKGGPDWRAALGQMRQAVAAGLRVRVDFNGLLQEETFLAFARAAEDIKEWVDFVEDPLPYEPARWEWLRQQTGWRLALDRLAGPERGGFDVRVLKPALESAGRRPGPVVFTSYLDHPLGQAFAAWEAARYGDGQELGGLLTHRLFLPDAFSERLARRGPAWRGPGGTGLGFDDLLEALPWVPLAGTSPAAAGRLWQNPRAPLPEGGPPLAPGQIGFATSGSTGKPSVVVHTDASLDASADSVNAWLQARAEEAAGLPVAPFMTGLDDLQQRAKLQLNFIDFVLTPLWKVATWVLPPLKGCFDRLMANRQQYEFLGEYFGTCRPPRKNRGHMGCPAMPSVLVPVLTGANVCGVFLLFLFGFCLCAGRRRFFLLLVRQRGRRLPFFRRHLPRHCPDVAPRRQSVLDGQQNIQSLPPGRAVAHGFGWRRLAEPGQQHAVGHCHQHCAAAVVDANRGA